jgi:hypothetical protein
MRVMPVETPHFVPALESFDDFVRHDGILEPAELERIARTIAATPDLWTPLVRDDHARRRYELLYEDERMDAWVLSWNEGQGTGFHDHFISSVGVCVAQGVIREDQMRYGMPAVERRLEPGMSRRGDPSYIHRVQHLEGVPAVSIHVYSPRLDWVGQYRVDDDGTVRREVQPGRNELKDQLIAEGALQGVLERF